VLFFVLDSSLASRCNVRSTLLGAIAFRIEQNVRLFKIRGGGLFLHIEPRYFQRYSYRLASVNAIYLDDSLIRRRDLFPPEKVQLASSLAQNNLFVLLRCFHFRIRYVI